MVYHSRFIISDSGTGQEEPALLETPVIVPRDYTERPQSYSHNCSFKLTLGVVNQDEVFTWIEEMENGNKNIDASWLGDGTTSIQIINTLKSFLE